MTKEKITQRKKPTEVLSSAGESTVKTAPKTLFATLFQLGPGIIITGSIVGSGELIATTKVGAEAGFYLLWLIIIGCVIKVFTQIELGRFTILTGRTSLQAMDSLPGPRYKANWLIWYWVVLIALTLSQQGGIVGGIGQTLLINQPLTKHGAEYNHIQDNLIKAKVEQSQLKSRQGDSPEVAQLQGKIDTLSARIARIKEPPDAYLWAGIISLATSLLLYIGRYRFIQIASTFLVASFTAVTITTVFILQTKPDWAVTGREFATGLSFRLPAAVKFAAANPIATALATFGIIGVGAAELIAYPYWCLEKGYARYTGPRENSAAWLSRARGWLGVLQTDAWLSMIVYTFATIAFYLLGAAVLGRANLNPEKADMIRSLTEMYVPVFGPWTEKVFLFGAFAVLYSTFFVAAAAYGRMITDALQIFHVISPSQPTKEKSIRIISVTWPLVAFVVYVFFRAPVAMVLICGLAQSIMLPMLGATALYCRYQLNIEKLTPSKIWDFFLWLSFIGLLIAGLWAVISIF